MMNTSDTKKQRGWLLPDEIKGEIKSGLYLISTPIGNLRDISLRALDTLSAVDIVACEDTRVSGKLLAHYGIKKTLLPYNDHSTDKQRGKILEALGHGKAVALISDAGTPLISDPGYKLVRDCRDLGLYVTCLPGANAPLSALQLSGQPSDKFCFLGFLPSRQAARRKLLTQWADVPGSLIAFETAPRLTGALEDIEATLGSREVTVAREITKMYEETRCGTASDLLHIYRTEGPPKGELVLVIAPPEEKNFNETQIQAFLIKALENMSTKQAATFVADKTGRPKKELYDMILKMNHEEKS